MGGFLIEVFLFLVALGVTEALIKPFMRQYTRRKVIRWGPKVLQALDAAFPTWLQLGVDGKELDVRVRLYLEKLTGESWSEVELSQVYELWDPRITADYAASLKARTESPLTVSDCAETSIGD